MNIHSVFKEVAMELSLLVIFWYGILHAFGPDHLTAIADFSIGKNKQKTLMITTLFAIGHGLSLFLFAKLLQSIEISDEILGYGDVISATVIIAMGIYLLFMVASDRIQLKTHLHEGKEHTHIWFGKSHDHDDTVAKSSSFTMGLLMGAGGVRGMLITLGAVGSGNVNFTMIGAFTAGVMLIFVGFGLVILYFNQHFLGNVKNVRRAFSVAGVISLIVGTNILLG
jgi:ABC-type nickel/cobalt efflux system permease component RcnA